MEMRDFEEKLELVNSIVTHFKCEYNKLLCINTITLREIEIYKILMILISQNKDI